MSEFTQRCFVAMGVSGCGKSSIGKGLADELGGTYFEGDDLHSPANIERMRSGTPLTDEDRWPWLESIAKAMASTPGLVVVGCSALRKSYRSFLIEKTGEPVFFVHLSGTKELIARRMSDREGHFMPTTLLASQFAALEPPDATEAALTVDISGAEDEVLRKIVATLQQNPNTKVGQFDEKLTGQIRT